ncbi:DUF4342 domain-containing protein [Kribbella sp. NPDC003557]|uniref:DUF4342 domain-containing protein n=1 Tax=Kribbella sp. NPDC003557 TaxID=3154449 RepID=UPI0033A2E797
MGQQVTTTTEKIDVKGGHLVEKVKGLVHEGNVRRIIIKNSDGKPVIEVPVTVGVVGFLVAPTVAALGAVAAYAADYSLEVERESAEPAGEEVTGEKYRGLLEEYVERYNKGDLDGVMELYAEDAVQLMPDGFFEGRSVIRARLAKELEAFSELAHRYTSYVEQGDAFADEFVFAGTHTGPVTLPDGTELPPTGRRVEVRGMELVRVRDGKVVLDNLYYDNAAVAAQLGLPPGTA